MYSAHMYLGSGKCRQLAFKRTWVFNTCQTCLCIYPGCCPWFVCCYRCVLCKHLKTTCTKHPTKSPTKFPLGAHMHLAAGYYSISSYIIYIYMYVYIYIYIYMCIHLYYSMKIHNSSLHKLAWMMCLVMFCCSSCVEWCHWFCLVVFSAKISQKLSKSLPAYSMLYPSLNFPNKSHTVCKRASQILRQTASKTSRRRPHTFDHCGIVISGSNEPT